MRNSQLENFVTRIETLEEEKKQLAADIGEVFGEAKEAGYNVKALRAALRMRKMEPEVRETMEAYIEALGELGDTPLGLAARKARELEPA